MVSNHITLKEYFPIYLAVHTSGASIQHSSLTFHCHNQTKLLWKSLIMRPLTIPSFSLFCTHSPCSLFALTSPLWQFITPAILKLLIICLGIRQYWLACRLRGSNHSRQMPPSQAEINFSLRAILSAALSLTTKQVYHLTLADVALTLGLGSLTGLNNPLHETQVVRYIAKLYLVSSAYSSIVSCLSAINFIHKAHGWAPPSASFLVSKALAGVHNLKGPSSHLRAQIIPDILIQLLRALENFHLTVRKKSLFRAMFLLAFYAFLRVGEMFA